MSIITEFCPKGSLSDVLLNDDVPINWGFRWDRHPSARADVTCLNTSHMCEAVSSRLSFATDIARGMSYLHQHKVFHGRLHSRNCVIDDRWVCKISGKPPPPP